MRVRRAPTARSDQQQSELICQELVISEASDRYCGGRMRCSSGFVEGWEAALLPKDIGQASPITETHSSAPRMALDVVWAPGHPSGQGAHARPGKPHRPGPPNSDVPSAAGP